jgi:serine/threonine-protein kinase
MDKKPRRPSASRADAALPPGSDAEGLPSTGARSATDMVNPGSSDVSSSDAIRPRTAGDKTLSQLGDYQLLKKIGSGAMGAVYKARQLSTGREVALKALFQHIADTPKLLERFYREVQAAKVLNHPNIVRGFEAGQDHGFHYFAMEYVDGDSLQKWLSRVGKMSLGDALHVILGCARALEYAHGKEIIHRDIKPDNILISSDGVPKLADLGMVKMLDEDMSLTQTGHAVGTPWYMPLEQAKSAKDADARCDIYALGCVFYALLTGRPPFTGKTMVDVIQAKEAGTFPPARQANTEVSERVDLILAKMTAKLPRYRYQTCAELIKDLESVGPANETLDFLRPSAQAAAAEPSTSASAHTPYPEEPTTSANDVWYLLYRRADGKGMTKKLTTSQVLQLAEHVNFDPADAKVSRQPTTGFRALATFKEFERVVLGKASKSSADKQTIRSRRLMGKIVEQEKHRESQQEGPVTTWQYWSGTVWRCAGVGLALVLLLLGASWAISVIKSIF